MGKGVPFSLAHSSFPFPFIALSTTATLRFDLISKRDLGLGNERKTSVEYMYRALCVHNFLFAQDHSLTVVIVLSGKF